MMQNDKASAQDTMTAAEELGLDNAAQLETAWARRLGALSLGRTRRIGGLTLYPLLGERDGALDYQTLDAALATGLLTIGEFGASGTVPELELKNLSGRRILIVDGEELIGAKQNRIVNTSVLVEAGAKLMLPVSCVEAGRWHADTAAFRSEGTHYNARGRQKKVREVSLSLADAGQARADQGRVWADVDAKLSHFSVSSTTRSLNAVTQAIGTDLQQFVEVLGTPQGREVGAVFALGREIVGLDLFDQSASFASLLPKLITSYALDAMQERPTAVPPPPSVVSKWLNTVQSADGAASRSVGLGEDVRLSASGISGAALIVEGTVVHLSAFRAAAQAGPVSAGMARASVRRRI